MKKTVLMLCMALFAIGTISAQEQPYAVVFYNLENLFDIYNDPETHDDEFTPEGVKQWTQLRYEKKLWNMERVLFDIAAQKKDYPIVIGVSEIENRKVLEDLISQPKLRGGIPDVSIADGALKMLSSQTLSVCYSDFVRVNKRHKAVRMNVPWQNLT